MSSKQIAECSRIVTKYKHSKQKHSGDCVPFPDQRMATRCDQIYTDPKLRHAGWLASLIRNKGLRIYFQHKQNLDGKAPEIERSPAGITDARFYLTMAIKGRVCTCVCVCACVCYQAVGLYVWSLQGDSDTVEEDEEENDVVKHLVTYDLLTPHPEPETKTQKVFSCKTNETKIFCVLFFLLCE